MGVLARLAKAFWVGAQAIANRLDVEMGTSRSFGGTGLVGVVDTSEIARSKPSWPSCRHALISPIVGSPAPIG